MQNAGLRKCRKLVTGNVTQRSWPCSQPWPAFLQRTDLSFQALRYPYFLIGHPRGGTLQSVQDPGKPQKDLLEKAGPAPHIKPVPPAQPPTKPHPRISSRPHPSSQAPQHLTYPYKAEASRTDHPSHLQEDKPSPLLLPSLHNKNPQSKLPAGLEHKNGEMKPKSRRRWGLISRSTKDSDDWADLDDLDFSPSLTRIDVKNKKRQSDDTLCRFESVLDLKPSEPMGTGNSAPTQTSYQRRDTPTLRSAAKQHYLKHSRYLPGINIRNGILPNPGKDFVPSNPWSSSGLSGKSSGTVSVISKINSVGSSSTSSSGLTGNYIPSFLKKEIGSAMQRVHLAPIPDPAPGYSSLKAVRPHPGRPFFHTQPRSTPGLIPRPPAAQPVHGRTDWASKYASRRWPSQQRSPSWGKMGHFPLANACSTCQRHTAGVKANQLFIVTLLNWDISIFFFKVFLNIDLDAIRFFV